jgi:hypothetical protein
VVSDTPSIVVPAAELQRVELAEAFERHRHDVFLRLHAHLGSLEARADLAGWLYTVTARLAMTRRRNERG